MSTKRYLFWRETSPGGDEYASTPYSSEENRSWREKMHDLDLQSIAAFITTERNFVYVVSNKHFLKRLKSRLQKACRHGYTYELPVVAGQDF